MEIFLAKYSHKGIQRTVAFNKANFDQPKAEAWLKSHEIQNFFFFFEPIEPQQFDEATMLFKGEIGFDITVENIMDSVNAGKNIIVDSGGGSHFEGLKIHDRIKLSGKNPTIGVIGICASAAFDVLMAGEQRWASENSRGLIHNPWIFAEGDDEEFRAIANSLEIEKLSIASMYSKISGKEQSEILALMKEERFMTPEEMLQWNFITEIKKTITNKKEEEMTKETEAKVSLLERAIEAAENRIKNMFKTIKNLTKTDVDGKTLTIEREDGEPQVGDVASPDGTFTFEDGMAIVVLDGKVSEITPAKPTEPAPDETEALKARIAELEAELAKVSNSIAETATMKAQYEAGIANVNAEIAALREIKSKVVIEGRKNSPTPKSDLTKNDFDKEKFEANRKKTKEGK